MERDDGERAGALGARERAVFGERGFLVLRGHFGPHEVALVQGAAGRLEGAAGVIAVPEAGREELVCRIEDFLGRDRELAALLERRVAPVVAALLGEPVVVFKEKLNFKRPGGGAFRPHQDYPAFTAFPPDYHVTAMLTVDPADAGNGCLRFASNYRAVLAELPGVEAAARGDGRHCLAQNERGDIAEPIAARLTWEALATAPADLVLFDSFVPHYSEPNRSSDRSRRAIFVTYNAAAQGAYRDGYYRMKRADPDHPLFHVGTPTRPRGGPAA